MDNPIELEFLGETVSTKNQKMPVLRRTGKAGIAIKPEARLARDRLASQIPGYLRDLNLQHPDVDVYFWVGRKRVDRDNIWSTICDLLVTYGVLSGDSVKHLNGRITLHPAVIGEDWRTLVILHPACRD